MIDSERKWRWVPEWIEKLLPPHPIEVYPNNNDYGRECMSCGFGVPSGFRYPHYDWCKEGPGKDIRKRVIDRKISDDIASAVSSVILNGVSAECRKGIMKRILEDFCQECGYRKLIGNIPCNCAPTEHDNIISTQ